VGNGGADGSVGGSDGSVGGSDGSAGGSDGSAGGSGGAVSDGSTTSDARPPSDGGCDDITLEPGGYGDCALLAGDACSIGSFQVSQCNDSKTTMKPFIAQQTIKCMLAGNTCDATVIYDCKKQMLQLACPDSSADDECTRITTACPAASTTECQSYLKGMTQAGRESMVTCMETDCSGLYSCVESL
jgi:hypothetical protein